MYKDLNNVEKQRFRERVFEFVQDKRFHGGNGFIIDFEKKVAIASSAIQITFGHQDYLLSGFNTIVIYEDVYMNHISGMLHKGETNPDGSIVVTWKYFVEGNDIQDDRINLGIHEMAHAYFIQILRYANDGSRVRSFLDKFIFNSEIEILKLRARQKHLFRDYAGENMFEFFAVAVEYFYEAPVEFKEQMPEIYKFMCLLLNQDPSVKMFSGFVYSDYFKSSDIKTISKIDEKVLFKLEEKPLSVRAIVYMRIFFSSFIVGLILNNIVRLDDVFVFLLCVGFVILASYLYSKISRNVFYVTENHIFEKISNNYSKELYKGIPFKNTIAFDFAEVSSFSYIEGNKYFNRKFILRDKIIREDLQNFLLSKRILSRTNNYYRSKFMFKRRR